MVDMNIKHMIGPERIGTWVAATFVLALLALVLGFVSLQRTIHLGYMSQVEVLMLNKKIEEMKASGKPAEIPEQPKVAEPAAK